MKKYFKSKNFYLFLAFAVLTVVSVVQIFSYALEDYKPEETLNCDNVYEPVCGYDGITYDNECIAGLKGAKVSYYGECYVEKTEVKPAAPTYVCPVNCKCDSYGKTISCYEEEEKPVIYECPYNCECDSYGKILKCEEKQPEQTPGKCYDTDNGPDPFVYGQAYIAGKNGEKLENLNDKCYSNAELAEAYCDLKGPNYDFQKCPNGCDKGKCYKAELNCKDTDGGKNYFQKGEVIFEDTTIGNKGVKSDACVDNTHLSEYVCDNGVYMGDSFVFCPDGCKDGACVGQAVGGEGSEEGQLVEDKKPLPPAGYEDEVITNTGDYDNPFPDTDMKKLEGKAAAELYRRGVIGGFSDGEFKKDRLVNRAETAKFLLLARFGKVDDMANSGQFPDVLEGQWYVKYVVTAAKLGIIKGYPDGTFKPGDNVNTAEFLKMLSLTFDLGEDLPYKYADVTSDAWYSAYAGIAQKYNLFPERTEKLEPGRFLTRAEVAVAIYQFLLNR